MIVNRDASGRPIRMDSEAHEAGKHYDRTVTGCPACEAKRLEFDPNIEHVCEMQHDWLCIHCQLKQRQHINDRFCPEWRLRQLDGDR